jgi:aspartyl-tRNA(Asn)/glutamyl-tRNA(Gln) amidotransferase subunit C
MLAFAMPAGITREEVIAIAALAELDLEPGEVDRLGRELGDILAYAEQVQRVDTTGVPPTASAATGHAGDRADALGPSLTPSVALANAPESFLDGGLFKVPRVLGS